MPDSDVLDAPIVAPDTSPERDATPDVSAACTELKGSWTAVLTTGKSLTDVVATARNDAWALPSEPGSIFHWDGVGWKEAPRKVRPGVVHLTRTIWASATNDVWVDDFTHWDGVSWGDWPAVDTVEGQFATNPAGLWGTGPNDMWAQVATNSSGTWGNSLLHWDGVTWSERASWTDVAAWKELAQHSIRASGSDNLWAMDTGPPVRWDGTRLIHMEHPFAKQIVLWVGGKRDAWVFGHVVGSGFAHYDGASWTVDPYIPDQDPLAIAGTTNDLWAVGEKGSVNHWDGLRWCRVDPLAPGHGLLAVSSVGPLDVWAISDMGIYHYGPK